MAVSVVSNQRELAQPHLLCVADSTRFVSLSRDWERVFGWTRDELMSRPFADFIHPSDRTRTIQEASKVTCADYEVLDFENRYRSRDGRWRWLRWNARADGRSWIAVATDVTAEHEASPAPAAYSTATARISTPLVAAAIGYVLVLLAVVATATGIVHVPGGTSSAVDASEGWTGRQGPPSMLGPVNEAGALHTHPGPR